jgi:hypothetical protein
MDQHEVHRAAGVEPAAEKAGRLAAGPTAAERQAPAARWEGYSLDTLAAVLDFEGLWPADW